MGTITPKHILLPVDDFLRDFADRTGARKETCTQTINSLHASENSIIYLSQLLNLSKKEFLTLEYFGPARLRFIEAAVKELGYEIGQLSNNYDLTQLRKKQNAQIKSAIDNAQERMGHPRTFYYNSMPEEERITIIEERNAKIQKILNGTLEALKTISFDLAPEPKVFVTIEGIIFQQLLDSPKVKDLSKILGPSFVEAAINEHPEIVDHAVEIIIAAAQRKLSQP